jgi:hypothetical protein
MRILFLGALLAAPAAGAGRDADAGKPTRPWKRSWPRA